MGYTPGYRLHALMQHRGVKVGVKRLRAVLISQNRVQITHHFA